jgi:hypothetical protein
MHNQLGKDQQRHRQQEADVNIHVEQERDALTATKNLPLQHGEQQQWQPGHERDDDDPLANHHQRIVGEMHPPQQLEERPAQDE